MSKPAFTEEEIEELNDLYSNFAYQAAVGDILNFLRSVGYTDVNAVVIEIRKEFVNKRLIEKKEKFQETYKDSKLTEKLCARMDWSVKQKLKNENNNNKEK